MACKYRMDRRSLWSRNQNETKIHAALEQEIAELEKRIEKLENELLQNKTMTVDIIGQDF